jgi:hypothetical protein
VLLRSLPMLLLLLLLPSLLVLLLLSLLPLLQLIRRRMSREAFRFDPSSSLSVLFFAVSFSEKVQHNRFDGGAALRFDFSKWEKEKKKKGKEREKGEGKGG